MRHAINFGFLWVVSGSVIIIEISQRLRLINSMWFQENLLFYEEVERFKSDFNFTSDFMQFLATETFVQNQIYKRSFDLFYTYTNVGSPLQVDMYRWPEWISFKFINL